MKYQVPQFTEVEDKIVGQLTLKQAIYLAGGAGMSFIVYTYVYFYIALILIAFIILLSVALAFYKVNNKPFIDTLEAAFLYYTKQNLYIWKKEERKPTPKVESASVESSRQVYVPRLSDSKLKDLAWSLDINENLNPLTGESKNTR